MSADNLVRCPHCKKNSDAIIAKGLEEIQSVYGKISQQDFLQMVDALREKERELRAQDANPTLEGYYEAGIYGEEFFVNYTARCNRCGTTYVFNRKLGLDELDITTKG